MTTNATYRLDGLEPDNLLAFLALLTQEPDFVVYSW